eukprot:NODE_1044_length_2638_cov_9.057348.p1 GENE.NODE_1044_length_2638_cov_9.057348~~NODE_1044_length_2638_cov_9.057348.p1  ORF type:complete len:829 (-),score=225.79 NODE_1044_length_2638_cov_9.057348:151-2340(-)
MVSGCSAAWALTLRELMANDGPLSNLCVHERSEHVLFTVMFAGSFQLVLGCLHCGSLARLVPKTALLGFLNGTAVAVFVAYVQVFRRQVAPTTPTNSCDVLSYGPRGDRAWYGLDEGLTWEMILLAVLVAGVTALLPLLPKVRLPHIGAVRPDQILPPALAGIAVAVFFEWCVYRPGGWETPLVKDMSRIDGRWPPWHVPDVPWGRWTTWETCLPRALALCAIGLVEALLTSQVVDNLTAEQTTPCRRSQECMAQGFANFICGFFSGSGGSALVPHSAMNVQNGARGRLSTFADAFWMIFWITVCHRFIEALPLAGLFGIFCIVAMRLFSWSSVLLMVRQSLAYYMMGTVTLVALLTIFTNPATAVGIGILWECVWHLWMSAGEFNVWPVTGCTSTTFHVTGDVFFANAEDLTLRLKPPAGADAVVIDCTRARLLDHSAFFALSAIGKRYHLAEMDFSVAVNSQDYERYMTVCDEYRPGDTYIRKQLPVHAMKPLEGRVVRKDRPVNAPRPLPEAELKPGAWWVPYQCTHGGAWARTPVEPDVCLPPKAVGGPPDVQLDPWSHMHQPGAMAAGAGVEGSAAIATVRASEGAAGGVQKSHAHKAPQEDNEAEAEDASTRRTSPAWAPALEVAVPMPATSPATWAAVSSGATPATVAAPPSAASASAGGAVPVEAAASPAVVPPKSIGAEPPGIVLPVEAPPEPALGGTSDSLRRLSRQDSANFGGDEEWV